MGPQLALLFVLALLSPATALALEVDGNCREIISGTAQVRIHYASGVVAEVEPIDADNITSQVDVFPDGRRVAQKWVGGLLPVENPSGRFVYPDKDATKLRLESGQRRRIAFTYTSAGGRTGSGTMDIAVEKVEKSPLGACTATWATIALTTHWAHLPQPVRIVRLFIKEFGFFVASTIEQVKDGKPELVTFRAMRVELMR